MVAFDGRLLKVLVPLHLEVNRWDIVADYFGELGFWRGLELLPLAHRKLASSVLIVHFIDFCECASCSFR